MIITADALDGLKTIESGTIDTCITSPPYFGLRDYGTATWHGRNTNCDHTIAEIRTGLGLSESVASIRGGGHKSKSIDKIQAKNICPKCSATRADNQIGIEDTPEMYIKKLVEVFREVKRVLRNDGTLWVNIGDSYAGSGKGGHCKSKRSQNWRPEYPNHGKTYDLKPKDLIGIPWRLAFALQADGWYLRQDIIWHKTNPMPESVQDRCTKSHEYIFLLSKSKKYYFDNEAIKEPAVSTDSSTRNRDETRLNNVPGRTRMSGLTKNNYTTRNKRDVWTVATKPYKEAHFAVFPQKLIEPCVLAGSRPGGIVLDPFCGSGTTGVVAYAHGREFIGIDLNPNYCTIAERRMRDAKKYDYRKE